MTNILEIKNLNKKYPNFTLKDVNITLPKGAIMGFIGENGAGKTTTIKAILNIIKDYEGSIKLFDKDNNDEVVKEDIGVVLDETFFSEILLIKDINPIMQGIFKNWDSNLFFKYLDKFNLNKNQKIKTLSKGMKKKLEIITAISHHPKLLILDEPTSGLDPVARNDVMELFQSFIENEDCAIFFSTHITTDLEHIADYITFINEGKIVLSKTKDEIIDNYGIVKCKSTDFQKFFKEDYLKYRKNKYEYEVLVENKKEFKKKYHDLVIDKITLEDLMVLMIKGE